MKFIVNYETNVVHKNNSNYPQCGAGIKFGVFTNDAEKALQDYAIGLSKYTKGNKVPVLNQKKCKKCFTV